MTRYAILAGVSEKPGFQQKSLCDIYDFLKSTRGGFWAERAKLFSVDTAVSRMANLYRKIMQNTL
ncbi:hypothetical protein [Treponema brennaborense]|uniref:Uncharacterized protein n=1 Tax=Treponema brennaborense (strain DSM 12168 / CIP 105900 / DD5/3) TaxID=906968 RepID=F4LNX1_TREBD|nr:hypothetical protein [Treponema brennaborense]AEE17948.1 hypothetical protein Trebr_2542 [Treponema brennaborense DSM 12168]